MVYSYCHRLYVLSPCVRMDRVLLCGSLCISFYFVQGPLKLHACYSNSVEAEFIIASIRNCMKICSRARTTAFLLQRPICFIAYSDRARRAPSYDIYFTFHPPVVFVLLALNAQVYALISARTFEISAVYAQS